MSNAVKSSASRIVSSGKGFSLAGRGNSAQAEDEALTYIADVGGAAGEIFVAEALEESDQFTGGLPGSAGGVGTGVDGGANRVGECAVMEDFAVNEKDLRGCCLSDLGQPGQFFIDQKASCQKAFPLFFGVAGRRHGRPAGIVWGDRSVFVYVSDTDPGCR